MNSKQNKRTQVKIVFIIFGLLFLSFLFYSIRKQSTRQLHEGLKMKDLKKAGNKIKKEAEKFTTSLFSMGIALLFALFLIPVLFGLIYMTVMGFNYIFKFY